MWIGFIGFVDGQMKGCYYKKRATDTGEAEYDINSKCFCRLQKVIHDRLWYKSPVPCSKSRSFWFKNINYYNK